MNKKQFKHLLDLHIHHPEEFEGMWTYCMNDNEKAEYNKRLVKRNTRVKIVIDIIILGTASAILTPPGALTAMMYVNSKEFDKNLAKRIKNKFK